MLRLPGKGSGWTGGVAGAAAASLLGAQSWGARTAAAFLVGGDHQRVLRADSCCPPPAPACRAREALRQCLPELLRNPQFTGCLKGDDTTRRWLAQLLVNVGFTEAAHQLAHDIVAPTPLQGA